VAPELVAEVRLTNRQNRNAANQNSKQVGCIEQCRPLGPAEDWPGEHHPITHTGGTKATVIAVPAIELTAPGVTFA